MTLFTSAIPNETFIPRENLYTNDLIRDNNYFYQIPIIISSVCPSNNIYDFNLSYCKPCEIGSYILNNSCSLCPVEALQCSDNIMILKPGYFIDNSNMISVCSPLQDSCL